MGDTSIWWDLILAGGLEPWNFVTFHSVGNVIIPTVGLNHQPVIIYPEKMTV